MNANLSAVVTILCIALLGFTWWANAGTQPTSETPPSQFIELVDNTLLDPLKEYKSGTVVLAFHDTDCESTGADDEQLQSFLAEKSLESSQVISIDVNLQRDLARKYNVKSVPEFFVMKNGRIVYRDQQQSNSIQTSSAQNSNSRSGFQSRSSGSRTLAIRE